MSNKKDNSLIIHIPHDLFQPSAYKTYDGCFNLDVLEGAFDTYSMQKPIKYQVTVSNTGDAFYVSGNAEIFAKTQCSRCLEEVDINLNAKVESYYLINKPQDEEIDEASEFEILPAEHNIDLGQLIVKSFLLTMPNKPVCKDDCKGLCHTCGKNLNDGPCDCDIEDVDSSNPFSVLKDLDLK